MILSGAGLIEASPNKTIKVHTTETTDNIVVTKTGTDVTAVTIYLKEKPYFKVASADEDTTEDYIYVMLMKEGEVISEPFIPDKTSAISDTPVQTPDGSLGYAITLRDPDEGSRVRTDLSQFTEDSIVMVDYYAERTTGVSQIEITADKFGGNYYLEASTLFRDTNGIDMPAEFIIPNCKIQSNFTFTMASSGDPSTFNFTMDAFPDRYGQAA